MFSQENYTKARNSSVPFVDLAVNHAMFALRVVQCCHLRCIKGLSEVANYGWLPVVSRCVSGRELA